MRTLVKKLYFFAFFDALMFIYPLYAIFFAKNGLSVQSISLLLMAWAIAGALLQIPGGLLADRYSRRLLLSSGQLLQVLAFLTWVVWPSFFGFLIGFILWAAKTSITGGTFAALMYDELSKYGHKDDYALLRGRVKALRLASMALAALAAALLSKYGFTAVVLASNVSLLISSLIALLLPEAKKKKLVYDKKMIEHLKMGFEASVKIPYIFYLFCLQLLVAMILSISSEYWALYYKELGLSNASVSVFYSISCLVVALGMSVAHRFLSVRLYKIAINVIVAALCLLLAGLLADWKTSIAIAITLLLTFEFILSAAIIVLETKIQNAARESVRATILSLGNFSSSIAIIFGFAFFALFSSEEKVSGGYEAVAVLTIIAALVLTIITWRLRHTPEPEVFKTQEHEIVPHEISLTKN